MNFVEEQLSMKCRIPEKTREWKLISNSEISKTKSDVLSIPETSERERERERERESKYKILEKTQ